MKANLRCALAGFVIIFVHASRACGQEVVALPPIESAEYDRHGGFRVNGRPFFPILLYDAPADDGTLRQLRDFGFNVLTCDAGACAGLPARGFYGAVHAGKKLDNLTGVFLAMGADSPALVFKKNLLQQVVEANAKVRGLVPARPIVNAIGYWEDEPAGVVAGKLPSREKYDDLVRTIDVSAPYLYPVPYQPIASVGDAVARARAATAGKKPVLPILQLFTWEAKARYPTPAELRCMAFLALVEGACGIGYFSYGSVTGQPKSNIAMAQPLLWQSIKKLNHDIALIGPRLVGAEKAEAFSPGSVSPSVKFKAVSDGAAVLAVLVNSAPTKQEAKLVWQNKNTNGALILEGGRQVEIKNGAATLSLEPFGVEIIRWLKPR